MCSRGVLVNRFSRLGAAVAVQAAEVPRGERAFAKSAATALTTPVTQRLERPSAFAMNPLGCPGRRPSLLPFPWVLSV
jgi:hypothetical protein